MTDETAPDRDRLAELIASEPEKIARALAAEPESIAALMTHEPAAIAGAVVKVWQASGRSGDVNSPQYLASVLAADFNRRR